MSAQLVFTTKIETSGVPYLTINRRLYAVLFTPSLMFICLQHKSKSYWYLTGSTQYKVKLLETAISISLMVQIVKNETGEPLQVYRKQICALKKKRKLFIWSMSLTARKSTVKILRTDDGSVQTRNTDNRRECESFWAFVIAKLKLSRCSAGDPCSDYYEE